MTRTITELLHLLIGVVGTLAIGAICARAVPQAVNEIWQVTGGVTIIVIFMGIRPLRLAWRGDRAAADPRD
ncbi:hypothetical protein QH494_06450 [Sphingomonas sp. AR_OL41]|uniref:hypothetical protein n=1 Tax=Sphingomonas sp. AR_OL41 TaxID=3042729 RepID=UPI0024814F6A|nr:hypothetical protein [Sphingomonas sp. AR_OL41]MDH7971820.1 hypothetical protein [Sphingomonas sp. AR_OL41]